MSWLHSYGQVARRLFPRSAGRSPIRRRAVPQVEALERRETPATLLDGYRVSYQDADGDRVLVTLSKPLLTVGNVNAVFNFGPGDVDGDNSTPQRLQEIYLTGLGPAARGVGITTAATRSGVTGGDGRATLGHINAGGIDLGLVRIDGDLGRLVAGDTTFSTAGVQGLRALSMGRYGLSTGAPDLHTEIQGRLGSLRVRSDIHVAFIDVQGGGDGRIGSVVVGGSLMASASLLDDSGRICSTGDMGAVWIGGDVQGSSGDRSGTIESDGRLERVVVGGSLLGGAGHVSGSIRSTGALGEVHIGGNIQGGEGNSSGEIRIGRTLPEVTIGGSLIGGGGDFSGFLFAIGAMGVVHIGGNVQGGSGQRAGEITTLSTLARVTIDGSLIGGGSSEFTGAGSGHINSLGALGTVRVGGNVQGGAGGNSGAITGFARLARVIIGGSLVGGAGSLSGRIFSNGALGTVRIRGNLQGGSAAGSGHLGESGYIEASRITTLEIGGSLIAGVDTTTGDFRNNGAIRVAHDIGTATIGNLIGNRNNPVVLSARGRAMPGLTSDLAIGRLTIRGRVEFAHIRAGLDPHGNEVNADAQIGEVTVGGDWIASNLAAGASPGSNNFFGDGDDATMSGADVKDDSQIFSRIASVRIGGQVLGFLVPGDHYGIVAQKVAAVSIGGTELALTPGQSNDDVFIGVTGDFRVHEV